MARPKQRVNRAQSVRRTSRASKQQRRFSLRKLRLVIPFVVVGLFVYAGVWGWSWLQNKQHLHIDTVHIIGERKHVSEADIEKIVHRYTGDNFVKMDVAQLQQALIEKPWVASVAVRKVWPNTIEVRVDEQQAVARWHDKGVLNAQGVFFFPNEKTLPTDLPVLTGPEDMAKKILLSYHDFSAILTAKALKIKRIFVTDRHAWQIQLTNGVIIKLGTVDRNKRLRRFARVWPKLTAHHKKPISVIDLRYPNGMAVR